MGWGAQGRMCDPAVSTWRGKKEVSPSYHWLADGVARNQTPRFLIMRLVGEGQ